ncbi:hypothetical protein MKEN_00896600 [Mycena kentingensis (nom. inval.)]|nr:hypothetical protein MKEN_00896600 [Mycena kentingensis (nom. inval.)]
MFPSLLPLLPTMTRYTTTTITAGPPPPGPRKRTSHLSLMSISSFESGLTASSGASLPSSCSSCIIPPLAQPIYITTTIETTMHSFPAPVPPPFTASLGSDERLPPPKRGAPKIVAGRPASAGSTGFIRRVCRALHLEKKKKLNPALCEGWD